MTDARLAHYALVRHGDWIDGTGRQEAASPGAVEKQKVHDEELLKSELASQDKSNCGWGGLAARPCALALPKSLSHSMEENQKVVDEWVDSSIA